MTHRTRIAAASVSGLGLLLAASGVAVAAPPARTPRPRPVTFQAVVVEIDADDDAATPDTASLEVVEASRRTRAALGTDAEIDVVVDSKTRVSGPRRMVRTADDLRTGDWVQVQAVVDGDGVATARKLTLRLAAFEGTASAFDGTTLEVTWDEANKPATRWLAENDEPADVELTVGDATRFDDDVEPVAGDAVEVQARPSADDPAVLEAVAVEVKDAEDDEDDEEAPATTTTSTTSTTVATTTTTVA